MNKNVKNDFMSKIEWRFYSYLVQYQLAKYDDDILGKEVSINHNSAPYLSTLRIDRIAREKKEVILREEANYKQKISDEINSKVFEKMENIVNNENLINNKYFQIPPILFTLIDKLYLKSTSISQLETYINNVQWLNRNLIDTIRIPYFAKQLQGSKAKIDTLRTTLGIMGENNLKYFIPKYIIEHNIPRDSSFPLIGRKIYEHSLMTGTACYHLATLNENKLNPHIAFTAGIFHEVGAIILFKMYTDIFEDVWREELHQSRDNLEQKRFNTISRIEPCRKRLRKIFYDHSRTFTKNIVRDFSFEKLPIKEILTRFCDRQPLNSEGLRDSVSEYVDILEKGNIYAESEELLQVKLITQKNKDQIVLSKNITKEELLLLSSQNLKNLTIS
jgi:hypothetical protein